MLNKSLISCPVLRRGGFFCRLAQVRLTARRFCGPKSAPRSRELRIAVQGTSHPGEAMYAMQALYELAAGSGQIEAIKVHHFGPCGNKVADEPRQSIIACIDFRQRTQLGV